MKWNKFSRFSAYARAESHLVQHTSHGALVTIFGVVLAIVLFTAEVKQHLYPEPKQTMSVDGNRDRHIKLSFDLTFPSLPCQVLSLDLKDASGEVRSDTSMAKSGVVHKYRLDRKGKTIGLDEFITPRPEGFFMRKRQSDVDNMNKGVEAHEGCHIYGWMDVQRVAANFHISVHVEDYMMLAKTQMEIQRQMRQQMMDAGQQQIGFIEFPNDPSIVNMSHIVKTVNFGHPYPGQINPLDGLRRIVDHDAGTFKYFLKVVPTQYRPTRGRVIRTNQYSVTEYWTKSQTGDMALPSIWLLYDMSAISVLIEQKGRSILHLLVRICAVVGGGFAVTGLLDRIVHSIVKAIAPDEKRR